MELICFPNDNNCICQHCWHSTGYCLGAARKKKKEVKIGEKWAQRGRRARTVMIEERLAQVSLRDRNWLQKLSSVIRRFHGTLSSKFNLRKLGAATQEYSKNWISPGVSLIFGLFSFVEGRGCSAVEKELSLHCMYCGHHMYQNSSPGPPLSLGSCFSAVWSKTAESPL